MFSFKFFFIFPYEVYLWRNGSVTDNHWMNRMKIFILFYWKWLWHFQKWRYSELKYSSNQIIWRERLLGVTSSKVYKPFHSIYFTNIRRLSYNLSIVNNRLQCKLVNCHPKITQSITNHLLFNGSDLLCTILHYFKSEKPDIISLKVTFNSLTKFNSYVIRLPNDHFLNELFDFFFFETAKKSHKIIVCYSSLLQISWTKGILRSLY